MTESKQVRIYLGTLSVQELMSMTHDLCDDCESENCVGKGRSCGVYLTPITNLPIHHEDVKVFLSELMDGMMDSLHMFYIEKTHR